MTDTPLFSWEETHPYSRRQVAKHRTFRLLTDRQSILALPPSTPIFSSPEEALAHLRENHPAPHPSLTYLHVPYEDRFGKGYSIVHLLDQPLFHGPESPLQLEALLRRYPSVWVPERAFFSSLPPPFHLTTATLRLPSSSTYRRLILSSSVSTRVATTRSNRASKREALLTGGPILPLQLFNPISSFLGRSSPRITISHKSDLRILSDDRSGILDSLSHHLLTLPYPVLNRAGLSHPSLVNLSPSPLQLPTRTERRSPSPALQSRPQLLPLLLPLHPHLPSLTSFPEKSPYDGLRCFLNTEIQPYWSNTDDCPVFNEGLHRHGSARKPPSKTSRGSFIAAQIARELRFQLRLHRLSFSSAMRLHCPPSSDTMPLSREDVLPTT